MLLRLWKGYNAFTFLQKMIKLNSMKEIGRNDWNGKQLCKFSENTNFKIHGAKRMERGSNAVSELISNTE